MTLRTANVLLADGHAAGYVRAAYDPVLGNDTLRRRTVDVAAFGDG